MPTSSSTVSAALGPVSPNRLPTFTSAIPPASSANATNAERCGRVRRGVRPDSAATVGMRAMTRAGHHAAAVAVITAAGHGEQFVHRTGHGIGLETHEHPYLVAGNAELLEPGMAFSVEPGIYVPGRYGARIEDIVVVTDDGVERLNTTTRELVVL